MYSLNRYYISTYKIVLSLEESHCYVDLIAVELMKHCMDIASELLGTNLEDLHQLYTPQTVQKPT